MTNNERMSEARRLAQRYGRVRARLRAINHDPTPFSGVEGLVAALAQERPGEAKQRAAMLRELDDLDREIVRLAAAPAMIYGELVYGTTPRSIGDAAYIAERDETARLRAGAPGDGESRGLRS